MIKVIRNNAAVSAVKNEILWALGNGSVGFPVMVDDTCLIYLGSGMLRKATNAERYLFKQNPEETIVL